MPIRSSAKIREEKRLYGENTASQEYKYHTALLIITLADQLLYT